MKGGNKGSAHISKLSFENYSYECSCPRFLQQSQTHEPVLNYYRGPNGIAFSPDEKYLYAGDWDIREFLNHKDKKNSKLHKVFANLRAPQSS